MSLEYDFRRFRYALGYGDGLTSCFCLFDVVDKKGAAPSAYGLLAASLKMVAALDLPRYSSRRAEGAERP